MMEISFELIANEIKKRGSDNGDSNTILDVLEDIYDFETELAKYFKESN